MQGTSNPHHMAEKQRQAIYKRSFSFLRMRQNCSQSCTRMVWYSLWNFTVFLDEWQWYPSTFSPDSTEGDDPHLQLKRDLSHWNRLSLLSRLWLAAYFLVLDQLCTFSRSVDGLSVSHLVRGTASLEVDTHQQPSRGHRKHSWSYFGLAIKQGKNCSYNNHVKMTSWLNNW